MKKRHLLLFLLMGGGLVVAVVGLVAWVSIGVMVGVPFVVIGSFIILLSIVWGLIVALAPDRIDRLKRELQKPRRGL